MKKIKVVVETQLNEYGSEIPKFETWKGEVLETKELEWWQGEDWTHLNNGLYTTCLKQTELEEVTFKKEDNKVYKLKRTLKTIIRKDKENKKISDIYEIIEEVK